MHTGLASLALTYFIFSAVQSQAASAASPTKPTSAPARRTCDESVMPSCEVLAKAPLDASKDPKTGFTHPRDGGAIFNLTGFYSHKDSDIGISDAELQPQVDALSAVAPKRRDISLAVMEKVRLAVMATVLNGTVQLTDQEAKNLASFSKSGKWAGTGIVPTAEQLQLIHRLQTVGFKAAAEGEFACSRDFPEAFPNAAYEPKSHTVLICAGLFNVTEPQIVGIVSHELGHVIDPCTSMGSVFRLDQGKERKDYVDCDPDLFAMPEEHPTDDQHALENVLRTNSGYAVGESSEIYFKKLTGCRKVGATEEPNSSVARPSLFASTMSCLTKGNEKNYNDEVNMYSLGKVKNGQVTEEIKRQVRSELRPSCQPRVQEQFADSLAAHIVSEWSEAKSWPAQSIKAAFMMQQGFACLGKKSPSYEPQGYPVGHIRLLTTLNEPSIARKLSCQPSTDPLLCPLQISGASNSVASKPAVSGKAKSQQ